MADWKLLEFSTNSTLVSYKLVSYKKSALCNKETDLLNIVLRNRKKTSRLLVFSVMTEFIIAYSLISLKKDVKELSWMSHRVIRLWFLLNFLFILGFFDILGSLLISRIFSSGFSGRQKSSCLDIPRTIIKCDYVN